MNDVLAKSAADELHPVEEQTPTPEVLADDYRFERLLGAGAQGRSYLARRRHDELQVVVKVMHLVQLDAWKSLELFEREALLLSQLRGRVVAESTSASLRVPQFVEYRKSEQPSPSFYLVSEYVKGRSAAQRLQDHGPFEEEQVWLLLAELAQILEALQASQPALFHRDLKPSNLLCDEDGHWWLIDFGAASIRRDGGSTVAGTFGYMAPEQFQGRASAATDIYGLGATALHLLSGIEPSEFPARGLKLDFAARVNASTALLALLETMLEPDEAMRISSARALREALQRGRDSELALRVEQTEALRSLRDPSTRQAFAELSAAPRVLPASYRVPVLMSILKYTVGGALLIILALGSVLSWLGFTPFEVLLLVLLPLFMVPSLLRTRRRVSRLVRDGSKARGSVRELRSGKDGTLVEYSFRAQDGTEQRGRVMIRDTDLALVKGDEVGVLYRPEQPQQSMLYPVPKSALRGLFETQD